MMRTKSGIFCALVAMTAFAFSCADSGTTGDDQGGDDTNTTENVCGDGTCATAEIGYCPTDCGEGGGNNNNATCGNGQCETTKGETASSCFSDCGGSGSGSGSGSGNGSTLDCNDQNVLFGCFGCLLDPSACTPPLDATACQACLGGGGLGSGGGDLLCEGGAPDGNCNAAAGEDATTCPSDCP
jgi:hypothetical protein